MADKKHINNDNIDLDDEDLEYELELIEQEKREREAQAQALEDKKRREREAAKERERKLAQEKLELLQLKNGVIAEEEATIKEEHHEAVKLTGMAWLSNFWYHNKLIVLFVVFIVAVVAFITYSEIKRERPDLTIMMIANNDLSQRNQELEEFFEKYTDDLDGNGYVHVDVINIPMSPYDDAITQNANSSKFFAQVQAGDAMIVITDSNTDETFMNVMNPLLSEDFPDNEYIDEAGFSFNSKIMAEALKYENMPYDVHMSIRYPTQTMDHNETEAREIYDKSFTVFKRIVEDITAQCRETDDPGLDTEPIRYENKTENTENSNQGA